MKPSGDRLTALILEGLGKDLLMEKWDTGFPTEFVYLKGMIDSWTGHGEDIQKTLMLKYFFRAWDASYFQPHRLAGIFSDSMTRMARMYDKKEAEAIEGWVLGPNGFEANVETWEEKYYNATPENQLRIANKMVKSFHKKLGKWFKNNPEIWKGNHENAVQYVVERIQNLEQRLGTKARVELNLVSDYINSGTDQTRRLNAFYEKARKASEGDAIDVGAIADFMSIIRLSDDFIEKELFTINTKSCDEVGFGGEGCVLHKFENGNFWYSTDQSSCSISAAKMNNCGNATYESSTLYNLMSQGETGKYNWHIMVEYNAPRDAIIQVLGKNNQIPKEKYWDEIKWFWKHMGEPIISPDAWEYVRMNAGTGSGVGKQVKKFLNHLGAVKSSRADGWELLKEKIIDGELNVSNWTDEQERPDQYQQMRFSVLSVEEQVIQVAVRMRLDLYQERPDDAKMTEALAQARALSPELAEGIMTEWGRHAAGLFDKQIISKVKIRHGYMVEGGAALQLYLVARWRSREIIDNEEEINRVTKIIDNMRAELSIQKMKSIGKIFAAAVKAPQSDDWMQDAQRLQESGKTQPPTLDSLIVEVFKSLEVK